MKNALLPLKAVRAITAAARLVRDPNRLGEVFRITDSLQEIAGIQEVVRAIAGDPQAKAAFEARRRLTIDLAALRKLPVGTVGRVFADHMIENGLSPDALPTYDATSDVMFFRAHLVETHDVWHAVTGFRTDVAGELGLQAFYFAQMPTKLPPILLAGGLLNTLFSHMEERESRMNAIARGWLLGRRAKLLFGYDWASAWARPMADVRRELGLDLAAVDEQIARAPLAVAA